MVSVRTLVEPLDFARSGPYLRTMSSASSRFTHASIVECPKSRSTAKLCRPSTKHKASSSSSSRVTVVAHSSTFRATPTHCLACSYWSLESGSGPPLLRTRLYCHARSTFLTSKVTSKPLSPQMSLHCRGRTKQISLNWTSISIFPRLFVLKLLHQGQAVPPFGRWLRPEESKNHLAQLGAKPSVQVIFLRFKPVRKFSLLCV